ncbi:MAG: MSCRAMM family adhesin SdrC [Treponema sp.]|nr:MSCRAMM family adhesin SdrC [Treponema sp.]
MADETSDFSFDDVVAQLDDLDEETPEKVEDDTKSGESAGEKDSASTENVGSVPVSEASSEISDSESASEVSVDEKESDENAESDGEVVVTSEETSIPDGDSSSDDESSDSAGNVSAEMSNNIEESVALPETSGSEAAVETVETNGGSNADENSSDDSASADSDLSGNESDAAGESDEGKSEPSPESPSVGEVSASFNPLDPDSVGKFLEGMGVPAEVVESKKCLIDVMQRENDLLDKILETQTELHNFVRKKNWECLNEKLESLQGLSDDFASLEEEREVLCELIDIRSDSDFSPVLTQVRGKLQRSKIENHALNEYISTTRKFLQGVFDSVVPQRRNVLYSKDGKFLRPKPTGVAVDIET